MKFTKLAEMAFRRANAVNVDNLSYSTGKAAITPKELPDRWGPVVSEDVVRQCGLLYQKSLERLAPNDNDCRKPYKNTKGNTMKYTTLPTKPGRYLDREGDAWTLYADRGWIQVGSITAVGSGCARHYLPFTDAPDDDKPTSVDDKMQRIDSVDDLKPGDLVYFRDDTRGYLFMIRGHGHYIRVALQGSGAPLWLCDALSGDVLVDVEYFDHAERSKPSWPEPEGLTPRLYLGADGKRYAYVPDTEDDAEPWWYQVDCGTDWTYAEWLAAHRPEALPLREFTTPEEEA